MHLLLLFLSTILCAVNTEPDFKVVYDQHEFLIFGPKHRTTLQKATFICEANRAQIASMDDQDKYDIVKSTLEGEYYIKYDEEGIYKLAADGAVRRASPKEWLGFICERSLMKDAQLPLILWKDDTVANLSKSKPVVVVEDPHVLSRIELSKQRGENYRSGQRVTDYFFEEQREANITAEKKLQVRVRILDRIVSFKLLIRLTTEEECDTEILDFSED